MHIRSLFDKITANRPTLKDLQWREATPSQYCAIDIAKFPGTSLIYLIITHRFCPVFKPVAALRAHLPNQTLEIGIITPPAYVRCVVPVSEPCSKCVPVYAHG